MIDGTEYKIVKINDKEFELRGKSCTDNISLYEENVGRYYAYFVGNTKNALWRIKDRNVEFIASKDASYQVYGSKKNLNVCTCSTLAKEWVICADLCKLIFKNGKCIEIINIIL